MLLCRNQSWNMERKSRQISVLNLVIAFDIAKFNNATICHYTADVLCYFSHERNIFIKETNLLFDAEQITHWTYYISYALKCCL